MSRSVRCPTSGARRGPYRNPVPEGYADGGFPVTGHPEGNEFRVVPGGPFGLAEEGRAKYLGRPAGRAASQALALFLAASRVQPLFRAASRRCRLPNGARERSSAVLLRFLWP
ncbi:hypothetical protein M2436_000123 [Streptomyces sp. HB372]|nr:hypothetical protein [Streptomyces sp. HB372]